MESLPSKKERRCPKNGHNPRACWNCYYRKQSRDADGKVPCGRCVRSEEHCERGGSPSGDQETSRSFSGIKTVASKDKGDLDTFELYQTEFRADRMEMDVPGKYFSRSITRNHLHSDASLQLKPNDPSKGTPTTVLGPTSAIGLAINWAKGLAMNESISYDNMNQQQSCAWMRIWWSCYTRDRLIALGMHRPMHIRESDFEIAGLSMDDFNTSPLPEPLSKIVESTPLV